MLFTSVKPFLYHFPSIIKMHCIIFDAAQQRTVLMYAYCYKIQSIRRIVVFLQPYCAAMVYFGVVHCFV